MPKATTSVTPSRAYRETARYKREVRALGLRVRTFRDALDWTLEQAAERCDLDLKHLQKIEAGTLNVTLVTLVRISAGLRQPLQALFAPREEAGEVTTRGASDRRKR